jgi:hypothetical protein
VTDLTDVRASHFIITGTTTITSLGSGGALGQLKSVVFGGAMVLTHSVSLTLKGSANITTAGGDTATFVQESTGNWRMITYTRVAGSP